jgi:hypothetical protein
MIVELRIRIDVVKAEAKKRAPAISALVDELDHLWRCALMAVFTAEGAHDEMISYLQSHLAKGIQS